MKLPEINAVTPTELEEATQRLADARQALNMIKEANRREGVLNEHTFHSEIAAAQLVERLGNELAQLKCSIRSMDASTGDDRTIQDQHERNEQIDK